MEMEKKDISHTQKKKGIEKKTRFCNVIDV